MQLLCRSCRGSRLEPVLSLGATPLANSLLTDAALSQAEQRYPLDVVFCIDCTLVQITYSVPPQEMFEEYAYFSSFADTVVENARTITSRLIRERQLGPNDLAMEIASNDGYLLRNYVDAGVSVIGVDPRATLPMSPRKTVYGRSATSSAPTSPAICVARVSAHPCSTPTTCWHTFPT